MDKMAFATASPSSLHHYNSLLLLMSILNSAALLVLLFKRKQARRTTVLILALALCLTLFYNPGLLLNRLASASSAQFGYFKHEQYSSLLDPLYYFLLASPLLAVLVLHSLLSFEQSFTAGEAAIIANLLTVFIMDAVMTTMARLFTNIISTDLILARNHVHLFWHALVLGMIFVGFALYPILSAIRMNQLVLQSPTSSPPLLSSNTPRVIALSAVFFSCFALVVNFVISPWIRLFLPADPFLW